MRDSAVHRLFQLRERPHHVVLLQRNEREPIRARSRSGHHLADVRERLLCVVASARREINLTEREQNLLVCPAVARSFLGVVHRFVDLAELEIDLGQIRVRRTVVRVQLEQARELLLRIRPTLRSRVEITASPR